MARYFNATKIYDFAALFSEQCLFKDDSLFWPGEPVWTLENLEAFWEAFIDHPDEGSDAFVVKWSKQLEGLNSNVYRLATEVTAIYCLFPYKNSMGFASKQKLVNQVMQMGPDTGVVNAERWDAFISAIDGNGIGTTGAGYLAARPFHIGMYLAFALEVKRSGVSALAVIDAKQIVDAAFQNAAVAMNYKPLTTRNMILHLLWPDEFEATASVDHKLRMAKNLPAHFNLEPLDDVDDNILQTRRHMEINGFERDFDMYSDDVQPLWDFNGDPPPPPPPPPPPSIKDLAAATHLDVSFLKEIDALLTDKKQLIFEGPPGSGKTFVAEKFARYFTGQPLDSNKPDDHVELIQFHQSYGYEDFVEGIRPKMDNGQLVYQVEAGVFLKMVKNAAEHPLEKYVLIIDEINRGNVSRILGELMLLLEYRDMSAKLPYSKKTLQIPPNLYIIGTMNSADRSLSQIDYALRRRFYFVQFMSVEQGAAPVLASWLAKWIDDPARSASVIDLFITLNTRLRKELGTDDLQVGHSYFMRSDIHDAQVQDRVWKYAITPLLREYLYHHRDRDTVLAQFDLAALRPVQAVTAAEVLEVVGDGIDTAVERKEDI